MGRGGGAETVGGVGWGKEKGTGNARGQTVTRFDINRPFNISISISISQEKLARGQSYNDSVVVQEDQSSSASSSVLALYAPGPVGCHPCCRPEV